MAQANVKLTVDASQATRALKGVQAQSTGLQNNLGRLKAAFAGVAITAVAKQAVSTASNFQALQLRMKVLTSEFGEFAQAQELVAKAQDKFNLSIVEATKGVTDIFARLRPLGISMKDIETTFLGFNTIAVQAGLSATEAGAAFTQLAQGLGSGRLQGDEFRSIAEQVPQLLVAISKETGIAEGKLKDFASKGLLKSDIILRALNRSLDEGADKIDAIMDASPAQVFKQFSNAVLELQITLGNKLLPTVLAVTKGTTALIEAIVSFVDSEAGQVTLTFIGIAAAIKGISVVAPILIAQAVTLGNTLVGVGVSSALASKGMVGVASASFAASVGISKATIAANAFKVALAKTGIGLAIVAFGILATKILETFNAQKRLNEELAEGKTDLARAELERLEKKLVDLQAKQERIKKQGGLKNILGLGEKLSGMEVIELIGGALPDAIDELKAKIATAEELGLAKEFGRAAKKLHEQKEELEKILERQKLGSEEERNKFDVEQRRLELQERFGVELGNELLQRELALVPLKKSVEDLKRAEEEAKKLNEAFRQIGDNIATGISDALVGAIEGTKTLGEAARSIVNNLASDLLRLGVNSLLRSTGFSLFKNLPGLANGGRASAGRSFVVGERGPEIFTPKVSGTVIPNNQIGGGGDITNITVNVDANESSVEGDTGQSQALGRQLATAIQTELIKQKRPGGLLA